ncbi:YkgJ family cysteine cluster protein [Candidatus Thorarchaeota archaeon]|nr:MAG: YkgJ family cysteine cluster protein [Candidatus Thorarchaeota archaeon]
MLMAYYRRFRTLFEGYIVQRETENEEDISGKMQKVCRNCGAHCCKYGGAIATKLEVQAILDSGYEDHFERIAQDVFITRWGADGICPYLLDAQCSIYEVRPLRCRAYPVLQVSTGEVLIAECPLLSFVSATEIERHNKLLSACPPSIVQPAAEYMEQHREVLAMRSSRFDKLTVGEAIAAKKSPSEIPPQV